VDIAQLQAYGYFALTAFLVVILYAYIYHLYSSQKKGTRDYEKYGNMALHDDITDELVEEKEQKKKKEEA
jgi:cytochrome c oxidase cbb3-type subunit 4